MIVIDGVCISELMSIKGGRPKNWSEKFDQPADGGVERQGPLTGQFDHWEWVGASGVD